MFLSRVFIAFSALARAPLHPGLPEVVRPLTIRLELYIVRHDRHQLWSMTAAVTRTFHFGYYTLNTYAQTLVSQHGN